MQNIRKFRACQYNCTYRGEVQVNHLLKVLGADRLGEPRTVRYVAERVGFEPTSRLLVNTLSKRAPSATRTPLRAGDLRS